MKNEKLLRRYLQTVCRQIPFPCRKKCRAELENSLAEFAEQNPVCTEETLCARFGTPTEFADSFYLSMAQDERVAAAHRAKTLRRAVFCLLLALTVAAAAFCGWTVSVYEAHAGSSAVTEVTSGGALR